MTRAETARWFAVATIAAQDLGVACVASDLEALGMLTADESVPELRELGWVIRHDIRRVATIHHPVRVRAMLFAAALLMNLENT